MPMKGGGRGVQLENLTNKKKSPKSTLLADNTRWLIGGGGKTKEILIKNCSIKVPTPTKKNNKI